MALWARLVRVFSVSPTNSPQGRPRELMLLDILGRISLATTMLILIALEYPPFLVTLAEQNNVIGSLFVVFAAIMAVFWLLGVERKW